jgi:DNA-binding NtrC family response regulator
MSRVLVIDDQSHVRAAISVALKAKGFDVVAVESGRLGLSELNESFFDVAIVDICMPEMDGVTLIKTMRERIPNLPIIVISGVLLCVPGQTALEILPKAPNLSEILYLQKPFRPSELLWTIQKAIRPISNAAIES